MLKRRVADMGGKEGESLRKVVQKLQDDGKLSSDDIVPLAHLSCNLIWLETFLATLHYQENSIYRLQQVCYNVHAAALYVRYTYCNRTCLFLRSYTLKSGSRWLT